MSVMDLGHVAFSYAPNLNISMNSEREGESLPAAGAKEEGEIALPRTLDQLLGPALILCCKHLVDFGFPPAGDCVLAQPAH